MQQLEHPSSAARCAQVVPASDAALDPRRRGASGKVADGVRAVASLSGRSSRRRISAVRLALAVLTLLIGFAIGTASAMPLDEALRGRVAQLRSGFEVGVAGSTIAAGDLIPRFYEGRGFRAAWTMPKRRTELLAAVERSSSHGLDPNDYHRNALRSIQAGPATSANIADRDLLFTDALIRLVLHLRAGKLDPHEFHADWNFPRPVADGDAAASALEDLLAAPSLVEAVEAYAPQLDEYRHLRDALAAYRAIEASGGWPPVPDGPTLRPGERDARIALLRIRLLASGDAADAKPADPEFYDDALARAVSRFQVRHSLEPDALVGRRTRAALNVDVGRRIDQIRANLERLRWVAQDIRGSYLLVDIAGFNARLYLDDSLVWSSKVVVGQPYRETPAFRAEMQYLVLNPNWIVPPTILHEDLIDMIAADPDYLVRRGMQVLDDAGREVDVASIDWLSYRDGGFPYRILQLPGPENPLGQVKFMLPNPHAVYLHDTPTKALFERTERAFSSGCIRLERPRELAALLLDDPERWNAEAVEAAIAAGETKTLTVRRKVPVLVLYHTAGADEDGTVHFHPDLYGRDPAVVAALARRVRPIATSRPVAERRP